MKFKIDIIDDGGRVVHSSIAYTNSNYASLDLSSCPLAIDGKICSGYLFVPHIKEDLRKEREPLDDEDPEEGEEA